MKQTAEEFDQVLRAAIREAMALREGSYLRPHTTQNPSGVGYYELAIPRCAELACDLFGLGPTATALVATGIMYDWNDWNDELEVT